MEFTRFLLVLVVFDRVDGLARQAAVQLQLMVEAP